MGFRFRKSFKLPGGFCINLSKSGVGYSWGMKGFRVTKSANGKTRKTYSIPGTGLSYVEESGKKTTPKKNSTAKENASMASRTPKQPKKKRTWPYVLVALLLIGGIGSALDGTDNSQTDPPVASTSATEKDTAQQVLPEEEAPVPTNNTDQPQAEPIQEPVQEPVAPPVEEPAAVTPSAAPSSVTVYVTPTGKRYHYDNHCNDGNYSPTTLDKAEAVGLTPCKRCAGG